MRQAFTNLFQNAVEAMPEGGQLRVSARLARDEGRETRDEGRGTKTDKSFVEISVSDTGTGITAEQLKKIFLPFFTTKDRGVGLGLALVHKIILSHGGRIEAESRDGQGTTFRVTLPARY